MQSQKELGIVAKILPQNLANDEFLVSVLGKMYRNDQGTLLIFHLGLSENSVPLHPMVNDHYPY